MEPPQTHWIIWLIVAYRLAMCIVLPMQTSFVPDEYYQTVEPAYSLVFDASNTNATMRNAELTWEWSPAHRIRSYVLLLPYTCLFAFARLLHIDTPWMIRVGPRILQALITSGGDFCLYLLVDRMMAEQRTNKNNRTKKAWVTNTKPLFVLVAQLFSWSGSYCAARTLANSTEASVVCMILLSRALASIADRKMQGGDDNDDEDARATVRSRFWRWYVVYIALSTLLVMARPTAVLLAGPAFLSFLATATTASRTRRPSSFVRLLKDALCVSIPTALLCFAYDSACYGAPTCTPCNFIHTNVIQNVAASFGRQPWHWNFSQGLPTVLGLYSPVVLCYLLSAASSAAALAAGYNRPSPTATASSSGSSVWEALPYSVRELSCLSLLYAVLLQVTSAHQEIRFLLPCLPGLHVLVGVAAETWLSLQHPLGVAGLRVNWKVCVCVTVAAAHVLAASYLLTRHQAGPEAAFKYVSQHTLQRQQQHQEESHRHWNVQIMAPCYSFPGLSYIHVPVARNDTSVTLHALQCSPFTQPSSDLAALLSSSPAAFIASAASTWGRADLLLTFDSIAAKPGVKQELARRGLRLLETFSHAAFKYDYDAADEFRDVLVFARE